MNEVSFFIPLIACRERQNYVDELLEILPINEVFYDDYKQGPLWNTIQALESGKCKQATHIMMLQDDCIPCDNLIDICKRIVKTHPDKIIAMFPYDFMDEKRKPIENSDTPYYEAEILSGLGVILPSKYRDDYLRFCKGSPSWFEDVTLRLYCDKRGFRPIQTIPALLQHRVGKSLLTPDNEKAMARTVKYFTKSPVANWESNKITIL